LGAAAANAVAQEIAQRTESPPLRFVNRKAGVHAYRARPAAKRPHIFVISVDMITPDHYHPSRALHREMDLPNIRSIARDGVVFHNATCVAPLCAPARAATATGRYTYITANGERAHDGHETILRPTDVIFQEYLKATGYITKHCGKGHLGTQKFMDAFDENDNAWDRWAPPIYDDEAYLAYLRRMGVKQQRYKKEIAGLQQDRNSRQLSLGGWIEQADGKPFPLEAQYSYYLAERAIEKLDAAMSHAGPQAPIYLQLDFFDPHQPFSVPDGFESRAAELRKAFPLPDSYEQVRARDWRAATDEPKVYHFYRKCWGLYNPETVRDYRVANALQMEVVDRAVGRFLGELKRRGLYDDSLVIFMADHGEMNGRQALVDKGVYLYPDVLRIPLYVKMPGVPHRTVDAPVSQLDIAPTLLEVAGVEPQARLDGQSLVPHLRGAAAAADRDLLFECGWHVGVNFACAIQQWDKNGHYLYAYNLSSEVDELRDMNSTDPGNLAGKPEHARRHKQMVARLGAFLEGDPRWLGYWHSFRMDHYHDLPRQEMGDPQMFRPI
jgi:arylsulfatase A-like enzyme